MEREARRDLDRRIREANATAAGARRELAARARTHSRQASVIARELKLRSREGKRRARENTRRRASARDVLGAIAYRAMFENGLAEIDEGVFSISLAFTDISYQSAREEAQSGVLSLLSQLYSCIGPDADLQVNLLNIPLPDEEIGNRRWLDEESQDTPGARAAARVMNGILNDKMREGSSNMERSRLLTVSVPAPDADAAWRRLMRMRSDICSFLEELGCESRLLDGLERLRVLQALLRPGAPFTFDYSMLSAYSPLRTKDYIAPMVLDFAPGGESTCWRSDGTWLQALVVRDVDSPLSDRAIAALADLEMPLNVTWHVRPYEKSDAMNLVTLQQGWISKEIMDAQKKAFAGGYSANLLPPETKAASGEAESLLADLAGQKDNLNAVTTVVVTSAESMDQLTEQVLQIIRVGQASGLHVELLDYYQREAMNTALPLGQCDLPYDRSMLTSELSIMVPFATQELEDRGGNWYYQNRLSGNLVLGDRSRLASPIGFISGKTGSGKGFFAKNEMLFTYLTKPDAQIIIFDRAGEYLALTEYLGGTAASFGVESDAHMNPLGLTSIEAQSMESQIANKTDAVIAQAAASAAENKQLFTDEERSIISRCVEALYRGAEPGREPVLSDLCELLKAQEEPQAQNLALRYERYVTGSSDFFNHPTNIDFDRRIVDINYREIPETMVVFALINACETVRQQVFRNAERGISTWIYVEEMESLFRYPTVIDYFRRFANEVRKYNGYLTGITQSADSMIRNPEAAAIVKNADFVMLLNQSAEDRAYWAAAKDLSAAEVGYIKEGTRRGDGLLIFGGAHIPIEGNFPTGNDVYRLLSTDPRDDWQEFAASLARRDGEGA